jgi:Flp pilus assembly protein TadD
LTFSAGYALWAKERRNLLLAQLSEWLDRERDNVRSAPKNIQIRGNFASQLTRLGLYEEAFEHYEALKEVAPKLWSLYFNLGIVCEKLGRFGDAEKNYKTSHELSPDNFEVSFSYATILGKRGKLLAALTVLTPLLQQYPDEARFLLLSGDLLWKRGEIDAARDAYVRASLLPGYQALALSKLRNLNKQVEVKNE